MDLDTIGDKLRNGLYANATASKADFDLMINNCRRYDVGDQDFVKKHGDRLVKEFNWEWSDMAKWMTMERRRLRQAVPAPPPTLATASTTAATAAPMALSASTSGSESPSSERGSASNAEPERISGTSPSPSLGSPQGRSMATPRPSAFNFAAAASSQHAEEDVDDDDETPKGSRVNGSSEDAVDVVMGALGGIMAQQIDVVFAEKEAEMAVQNGALWVKIWGPRRLHRSREMWRGKCFSKITREEWPRSEAAIRAEVLQAFNETCREQLALLKQEAQAEEAVFLGMLQ